LKHVARSTAATPRITLIVFEREIADMPRRIEKGYVNTIGFTKRVAVNGPKAIDELPKKP
jgi:hypothetical protein